MTLADLRVWIKANFPACDLGFFTEYLDKRATGEYCEITVQVWTDTRSIKVKGSTPDQLRWILEADLQRTARLPVKLEDLFPPLSSRALDEVGSGLKPSAGADTLALAQEFASRYHR